MLTAFLMTCSHCCYVLKLSDTIEAWAAGKSGSSVTVNSTVTRQHLSDVAVPPLPSVHAGGASTFTCALTAADPQPACSDAIQVKNAEAKLSQTCTELAVTRSQLQVIHLVHDAAFFLQCLAAGSTNAAKSYGLFSTLKAAPVLVLDIVVCSSHFTIECMEVCHVHIFVSCVGS